MSGRGLDTGQTAKWLVAAGIALAALGCGAAQPTPRGPPTTRPAAAQEPAPREASARAPTTLEANAIGRLVAAAERIRELRFREPPRVEIESPEAMAAQLDRELDEEELVRTGRLYRALGLLPDELDLRSHLRTLLTEQVLGYYDTKGRRLVLRDSVAHVLATRPRSEAALESHIIVVHELVHALQDQRLDLGQLQEVDRASDADVALHALVEGDATFAMLLEAARMANVPAEVVLERSGAMLGAGVGVGSDELARAPPIVRVSLVAPYVMGFAFVRALHARGGWPAVDEAFRRLPRSSEQVLHPDAYFRDEAPEEVELPALGPLGLEGWTAVHEDTLGELELGVFLARDSGRDAAPELAIGWGGDRVALLAPPEGVDASDAVVWATRWDDEAAAARVERALRVRRDPREAISRSGRDVLIVRR